jgi:hypothetical protein
MLIVGIVQRGRGGKSTHDSCDASTFQIDMRLLLFELNFRLVFFKRE